MNKDKRKYNVLIIEDNFGDFSLVEDYLQEKLISPGIFHAKTFSEAKKIFGSEKIHFDSILLDLSLPDKNGEELINEIVKLADSTPVIVLTGYSDMSFGIRSLSLGVFDYLLKDELTPTSLYKSILYNIERKRSEQELVQKNQELSTLFGHLQNIREEERMRIAREIHDELGQELTALKMDIDWIRYKQTNPDQKVVSKLDEMLQLCDGIISNVRRISSDLRPAIIDDLGLIASLEWKCADFEKRSRIPCLFTSELPERKYDKNFSIAVYRILQETLTNVSRHAEAKSVHVSIWEDQTELVMEVIDDGKGLRLDPNRPDKPLGIRGMKERAALMGGALDLAGEKNAGTVVTLRLPME
ncbi:MAG: histidine kinase [Bacteroidota bacterium]|nr:histidine kinase [Bacteroidota bacterium]